jgi:ferrochelatase
VKQAVLLLAHGAPERVEDVPEYLGYVRGGQPVSPKVVEEVAHRYQAIGGGSPLLRKTREQAEALAARLHPVRVYFAMRNWHPFIADVMRRIQEDGVDRVVAICLAPQYSKFSVGLYFRRVQEARQALGMRAEIVWTKSFHDHPDLIAAFACKLKQVHDGGKVLFTAHSLPTRILETADPYDAEARATARLVAEASGLADWDFAYQSQGMTQEPWLGPTVEEKLEEYAAVGLRKLVLHPIGFVSDHVEVLFDVDVLFRSLALERGIELIRPESLNSDPRFIEALAKVASQRLI